MNDNASARISGRGRDYARNHGRGRGRGRGSYRPNDRRTFDNGMRGMMNNKSPHQTSNIDSSGERQKATRDEYIHQTPPNKDTRPSHMKYDRQVSENSNRLNIPPLFPPEDRRQPRMKFMGSRQMDNSKSSPSSTKQNNGYARKDNMNQAQPPRVNKRPVNSPTSSVSDSTLQKSFPVGSPQNQKTKKKRKVDADVQNVDYDDDKDLIADLPKIKLDENKSFAEQTEELIKHLELTDCDRRIRLDILQDVKDVFAPYLEAVEPQIFGSTLTNTAFRSSDLDVFLYCPYGQPGYNFVAERGKVMYRATKFRNIVRVLRARVPLVKAVHRATNVHVDISSLSGQAVRNSRFLKYLISVDSRIRPLAMLISMWCKLNGIIGRSRFTSYSFILMIIFYLQTLEQPILPPLKDLLHSKKEDEWPTLFNAEKVLKNENTMDIAQLFKGFFNFFLNINFEKYVISPYLGEKIPVTNFLDLNVLSDDFNTYKYRVSMNEKPFMLTNLIHVQDPMEHNVNTTKGVYERLYKSFCRSCERLINICSDREPQNKWLPAILKNKPPKYESGKKSTPFGEIIINYPVVHEDWYDMFKTDFKKLLEILQLRIIDDKYQQDDDDDDGEEQKQQSTNNNELLKDTFLVDANVSVFCRQFRPIVRFYTSKAITLPDFQNLLKGECKKSSTSSKEVFKSKITLEMVDKSIAGRIKVKFVDLKYSEPNSFDQIIAKFKYLCCQFLTDILADRKLSEDILKNGKEVTLFKVVNDTNKKTITETSSEENNKKENENLVVEMNGGSATIDKQEKTDGDSPQKEQQTEVVSSSC